MRVFIGKKNIPNEKRTSRIIRKILAVFNQPVYISDRVLPRARFIIFYFILIRYISNAFDKPRFVHHFRADAPLGT